MRSMRITTKCPKCGQPIQPTDTVCMNCGADLIQADLEKRQDLQENSVAARRATEMAGHSAPSGARAGQADATESSEETRLRVFDQHEAARLAQERLSCYVTAALVALPGLALLILGIISLHKVGLAEVQNLTLSDLRNWDVFADLRIITVVTSGLGLAGVLTFIGLIHRGRAAGRAIRDVKKGEKPTIVSLTTSTYVGLLLTAGFCPPLGLIIGIALKFSSDNDIRGAAGNMIKVSLVVIGVLLLNLVPPLFQSLRSSSPAA